MIAISVSLSYYDAREKVLVSDEIQSTSTKTDYPEMPSLFIAYFEI